MRADEVERLLVRDVLHPDEVIERRVVESDQLRLVTQHRDVMVHPAPWAIAHATGVVDAVRVYVEHELPGADRTYGYLWLSDGHVLLLNNVDLRVPLPSGRLALMQFHFSYDDRNSHRVSKPDLASRKGASSM